MEFTRKEKGIKKGQVISNSARINTTERQVTLQQILVNTEVHSSGTLAT